MRKIFHFTLPQVALVAIVTLLFSIGIQSLATWSAPIALAPGGNVATPLNVSNTGQTKIGGLILNTGNAANGLIVAKGNVGIGTTNPTAKLEVSGDIKADSGIILGGVKMTSWPSTGGTTSLGGGSFVCIGGLVWDHHDWGSVTCAAPHTGYYRGLDYYLGGAAVSNRVYAHKGDILSIRGYWIGGTHGCRAHFFVNGVIKLNDWGDWGCPNSLSNYAIITAY